MNPGPASELRPWSAGRWCGLIVLIFGLQVGCIFWLSQRRPAPPAAEESAPVLHYAGDASPEFLALNDPSWFALPHRQGFSGPAWLKLESLEFPRLNWSNAPTWLRLPQQAPGADFYAYVGTNSSIPELPPVKPDLALGLPDPPQVPLARERSVMRPAGDLAHRALLTPFELAPQTNSELLTNSVVQTLVDAKGWPRAVALLAGGSRKPEADQEALRRAARARFAPLPAGTAQSSTPLAVGLLVFEWQTLPPASTNAPAPAAQ